MAFSVRARELRFAVVPETRVWFEGEPDAESSIRSERERLPEKLEPGVTYRRVAVRWRAEARLGDPTDPDVEETPP
jgi:hypothetical protein